MSAFDVVAGFVLTLSSLVGLWRGATREATGVLALVIALAFSILGLRFTAPLAHIVIPATWLADTLAVIGGFAISYVLLRLIGATLTKGVRASGLSGPDRILGLMAGFVRGWVAVSAMLLLVAAATTLEHLPKWVSEAKLYPLADTGALALRALAPKGLSFTHDVAPALGKALAQDGTTDAQSLNHDGADKRPNTLQVQLEKTR